MNFHNMKPVSNHVLMGFLLIGLVIVPLSSLISPVSAAVTVLTSKWTRTSLPANWEGGMVIGDVDNDGFEEVIYSGKNYLYVLNPVNGLDKYPPYMRSDSNVGKIAEYSQPQMDDINGDGRLEIIVPLYYHAGIAVLRVNDANTAIVELWSKLVQTASSEGSCMSKPVTADINGDGYSEIFIASQDVEPNGYSSWSTRPNGAYGGTVTAFYYNGTQFAQTFAWRSCSGGLSIADTDRDGDFELYMGDRDMYMGDGDYGKGCRSFWAKNLTQRWNNPSFLCSSQAPILVDVNNDGILDIVVSDQRGGIHVLNSTNGAFIKSGFGLGLPVHYQLTVYDIDADGHLEALMCDGDHSHAAKQSRTNGYPDEMYVFDLTNWKVDKIVSLGSPYNAATGRYNDPYNVSLAWNNKFSPLVADIYSNGNNADGSPKMEIIVGANTTKINLTTGNRTYPASLLVFANNYTLLQNVTGLTAQIAYPFVQDIDKDNMLEVVVQNSGGTVRAYDTVKSEPAMRIRSELSFFSERRMGAAVYVPKPWDDLQAPLVAPVYPGSDALSIPTTLQTLSFRLADHQGNSIRYTVTSSIGSGSGNVKDGVYSVRLNTTLASYRSYSWTVRATDGTYTTTRTYSFRTAFGPPTGSAPSQGVPSLVSQGGGNSVGSTFACYNQSTSDSNGDKVANLYKWYLNGASVSSVLMPFNTRNDTVAKDYSGYGNDGTVYGATWVSNGIVGGAYSFDGSNDYVAISDGGKGYYNNQTSNPGYPAYHASLGGDGTWTEITVEHWIYLSANSGSSGSWRTIAKFPSYEIGFQKSNNKLFGGIWVWERDNTTTGTDPKYTDSKEYTVKSNTVLSTGKWYHVVLTYKSLSGLRLYLNGKLDAQLLSTTSSLVNGTIKRSSGEPVFIGGGVGYFKGSIDEVRIYPRMLSTQQVQNRYAESKSGFSNNSLLTPAGVGATAGSALQCEVIPSDSQRDGLSKWSNTLILTSSASILNSLIIDVSDNDDANPVPEP